VTIAWNSSNATACTAYGTGWGGAGMPVGLSGSDLVTVTTNETYLINCDGAIDQVALSVSNTAPDAPTITQTGGSSIAGESQTFTFLASDPNGDQIYYDIDWNNDGIGDDRVPAATTVPSGTSRSDSTSWPTDGTYTFQARTVDAGGTPSGWTSHTIDISPAPSGSVSVSGCAIPGGSKSCSGQVTWTISAASSPTVIHTTTGTTISNANTGTNVPVTLDYGANTIEIRDGATVLDSASVNVSCGGDAVWDGFLCVDPDLSGAILSATTSATFDPATGNFDSVVVRVGVYNSSEPITGTFTVVVDVDRDGPAGPLPFSSASTYSITDMPAGATDIRNITFNDIPFGGVAQVRVRIDSGNDVSESNEGNNLITSYVASGAPPLDMDLTLIPSDLIRGGETVDIDWDTNATFSMDCELSGPALTTYTFNPNTDGQTGSRTTGPITNKSEYTLSCTELVSGLNFVFTESMSIETTGFIEEL
jgi:hypothetical protein